MSVDRLSGRGGRRAAALVVFLLAFTAASCRGSSSSAVTVTLVDAMPGTPAFVRVTGVSDDVARRLAGGPTQEITAWQDMVQVSVAGAGDVPITGTYRVDGNAIEFQPQFGFDAGREYAVRVNPSLLGGVGEQTTTIVKTAARADGPAVRVTGVSPAAGVWPENLLRFYIHFSAPMSRTTAIDNVRLLDGSGVEILHAFLPLDVDLWNPERTRFTVFFDPGRVKRGIKPNRELGRALIAGRKYAIAVSDAWPDANGRTLVARFTHEFVASTAEERAIDPARWQLQPAAAGTRDALVVTFPWALDHALLQRAIGVSVDGKPVDGLIQVADDDRTWQFIPASPWKQGSHALVVLDVLEDPAGNRVGRAFEFQMLKTPQPESPERVTVPFTVK